MSLLKEFINLGVNLVNKDVDLTSFFSQYVREDGRIAILTITDRSSKFGLFANKIANRIELVEPSEIKNPTVEMDIPEDLGFYIACRIETILSAFLKGYPVEIRGPFSIRDAKLMDKLLDMVYDALREKGKDLCMLLFDKPREELVEELTYGRR